MTAAPEISAVPCFANGKPAARSAYGVLVVVNGQRIVLPFENAAQLWSDLASALSVVRDQRKINEARRPIAERLAEIRKRKASS